MKVLLHSSQWWLECASDFAYLGTFTFARSLGLNSCSSANLCGSFRSRCDCFGESSAGTSSSMSSILSSFEDSSFFCSSGFSSAAGSSLSLIGTESSPLLYTSLSSSTGSVTLSETAAGGSLSLTGSAGGSTGYSFSTSTCSSGFSGGLNGILG